MSNIVSKMSVSFTNTDSGLIASISDTIKVKLMCNWTDDLTKVWCKMAKSSYISAESGHVIAKWNNLEVSSFFSNPDYYVIINKPLDRSFIPSKTIVFRMEPDTEKGREVPYSEHWDKWFLDKGLKKSDFMYFMDQSVYLNNIEWWLNLSFSELLQNQPKKTKCISSVVSSQYFMKGHKMRIDFLKYIEKTVPQNAGLKIDIYGKDNKHNFKGYISSLPEYNKNDGILPYKYTYISENSSLKNYITEKLYDAILGECLCFYWGAPNVSEILDSRSFVQLSGDFETDLKMMKEMIETDEWSKRIEYIRKEKFRILKHLSFFSRVESLIKIKEMYKIADKNPDFHIPGEIKNASELKDLTYNKKENGDLLMIKSNVKDRFIDRLCERISKLDEDLWKRYEDEEILLVNRASS